MLQARSALLRDVSEASPVHHAPAAPCRQQQPRDADSASRHFLDRFPYSAPPLQRRGQAFVSRKSIASIEEEKEREQRSAWQQDLEQQIRTRLLRKISENSEAPCGDRSHVAAPSSSMTVCAPTGQRDMAQ